MQEKPKLMKMFSRTEVTSVQIFSSEDRRRSGWALGRRILHNLFLCPLFCIMDKIS